MTVGKFLDGIRELGAPMAKLVAYATDQETPLYMFVIVDGTEEVKEVITALEAVEAGWGRR
jgi:hypothetical protein